MVIATTTEISPPDAAIMPPVYPPYAIFWWWFSYEAYAPRIFETGMPKAVNQARPSSV